MAVLDHAAATAASTTRAPAVAPVRSTPQSLRRWIVTTVLVTALVAGLATAAMVQRHTALDRAASTTEPLVLDAQTAYTALSDADSTAAGGLLAGAVPPPAVVEHYRTDVATAAAAVSAAQRLAAGDDQLSSSLGTVAVGLPVYTGLVERASSERRVGHPVASAYLGEASNFMRTTLLPAADAAYQDELATLQADQDEATRSVPVTAALVGVLLLLAVLIGAQARVRRRFRRAFNVPLLAATGILIAATLAAGMTLVAANRSVDQARAAGSLPLASYTEARILAQQVRADDELTLLYRESVSAYQKDLTTTLAHLQDLVATQPDTRVTAAVTLLTDTHAEIRGRVQAFHYDEAVTLAVRTAGDSPPVGLPEASQRLDGVLKDDVTTAQGSFETAAAASLDDVAVLAWGLGALVLLAGVLAVVGLGARLREYR